MGALEQARCEGAYKYYLMKFDYIHRWCIVVKDNEKKQRKNIWRTREWAFKSSLYLKSYYISWGHIK